MLAGFERPTTVIYEGALYLAPNVINQDGSIAIRLVQDPFCRHLVKRLRKPIVSTSANISGAPSPGSFKDVSQDIRNGVDYVVEHRQEMKRPPARRALCASGKTEGWKSSGIKVLLPPKTIDR